MAARYSQGHVEDAESLTVEAEQIRVRAARLADADAVAYRQVLVARAEAPEQVRAALRLAAEIPLEVAELGARTAGIAARVAAGVKKDVRGDAVTGLFLAEAATRAAAHLVTVNVEAGAPDAGLVTRAEQLWARARDAVATTR